MFAVGVNLQLKAFAKVFKTPKVNKFAADKVSKFVYAYCLQQAWSGPAMVLQLFTCRRNLTIIS